ncbi:MAG: N-acetyl-gamma-glutamyl-phosphate reductase [Christensenellaceae bacterium]
MKKIFIDGSAGTTGLRIYERLGERKDIELIALSGDDRKSASARKSAINDSDVTFLCLPDDASRQSVSFLENDKTVIIDTSTAHRTESGWLYGFPEVIADFDKKVKTAKKIAVPGCHASGYIALVKPLVDNGILKSRARLSCTSLTGYSGGGKKMIADYESDCRDSLSDFPRQYGLSQTHKHLKEMVYYTGTENAPCFLPIVAPFYSGMEVTVPLFKEDLTDGFTKSDIVELYKKQYNGKIVFYDGVDENGFLSSGKYSKKDVMGISVFGNDDRILLVARYDNLGKGASGAAIECLNYVLGADAETGLEL